MTTAPKPTMFAYTHTQRGHPSTVLSPSQIPKPRLASPSSQVLVRISHCALNPGGSIVIHLLPFLFRASPAIPEMDFAGTIEQCHDSRASKDNGELKTGMQVFGSIPVSQHVRTTSGSLAEYVVVDRKAVCVKPVKAKLEEVAGLGIAGATALELMKSARLKRGYTVLVVGASGGIGHLVVQMCRNEVGESGRVVGVCGGSNVDWVKGLGCNEVIDYSQVPVHEILVSQYGNSRFNAIIDAVGIQSVFENCPRFLAEGRPYVSVGPRAQSYTVLGMLSTIGLMAKNALWPRVLGGVPRQYRQVASATGPEALAELAKLVDEGKLRVDVGLLASRDEVNEAYERMLSGHPRGKIVVAI